MKIILSIYITMAIYFWVIGLKNIKNKNLLSLIMILFVSALWVIPFISGTVEIFKDKNKDKM